MKKTITLATILFLASASLLAQEAPKAADNILLNLDTERAYVEAYGVPTVASVEALSKEADSLFAEGDWEKAIDRYQSLAQQSNWLANLLTQCLNPYYNASYDDKKRTPLNTLNKLSVYEKSSNEYKMLRDRSFLRIALCYKQMNKKEECIMYLYKTLDKMSMKESADWQTAMQTMCEITGYVPEK